MSTTFERHPLIPESVETRIPRDKKEAEAIKSDVKKRLDSWIEMFGSWPEAGNLDIKIHSERRMSWFDGFHELYITYTGEQEERIPAYLLIPHKGKPPFSAVVANHQCFVDCDVGKDVVVGKAYLRPDQAYGFELALEGFVVLAPDSINCGERNVKGVRNQGERDKTKCWDAVIPFLSVKSFYLKHLWDAVRAVDVLVSLDYVDSNRIGMIGHSLGAGTTLWTAAFDKRVKASVMSCQFLGGLGDRGWHQFYLEPGKGIFYHELLQLVSPRALLATRGKDEKPLTGKGDFATPEEENAVIEWAFELGKLFCRLQGVSPERMQVRFFEGGHEFPEQERHYAYRFLKEQLNKTSNPRKDYYA